MLTRSLLALFFLPLLAAPLVSQGWDHLRNDDHLAARAAFEAKLAKDSMDVDALKGMIILSDIHGDGLNMREYLTRYTLATWDSAVYPAYSWSIALSDTVIAESRMSMATRLPSLIDLAGEHRYHRQYEKAEEAYRALTPEHRWRMIGPFENIGGSGYETVYPVETERFDPDASYSNRHGVELRWIRPSHVELSGEVSMNHHLPDGDEKVTYANAFIEMPEDRTVELRLGRSSPIKIWVDDDLVFADPERISLLYDDEIIRLDLAKGTHRILVKLAPYQDNRDVYSQLVTQIPSSPSVSNRSSAAGRSEQGYFVLRITDEAGNAMRDVTLAEEGSYTPRDYDPVVRTALLLEEWKRRVDADPNDLFSLYFLAKTYIIAGRVSEGEAYFVRRMQHASGATASTGSTPDDGTPIVMRWLAARLHGANGKLERLYAALEPADPERTPIYGLLDEKLDEIDPSVRETEFLAGYERLRRIAPSDMRTIRRGIRYYDEKNRTSEKDAFIDEVVGEYPEYEERLESDRSDYAYRGDIDERTPAERADSLLGVIETQIDLDAYDWLIDYYTDKEEVDRVVDLHEERIEAWPSYVYYRRQLAEYLREEKRYDEAIEVLESAIDIIPYSVSLREDIGDIYVQMEQPEDALGWYEKAREIDLFGHSYASGYRDNSVVKKIENIVGAEDVEEIFSASLSFEDELESTSWMARYADEESVIPLYEKRQVFGRDGRIRTWSKMMVRILTEAGADFWTEYSFSGLGRVTSVRVRKASGGEVVPDRRGSMVVFKNLEPGDVIMIEGENEETRFDDLFDGDYYDITVMTFGAPIHRARVEILTPPDEPINYRHHRLDDNLKKTRHGNYDSWVWDYTDLDRVPEEDAQIDGWDPFRTIFVTTMFDWKRIVDWYLRKTYRRTEPTWDVAAIADSVAVGASTNEEKITAVYDYVTRRVNYSHVNFLNSAFTPKASDLTLSSNVGDCKDVATLMIAMLEHLGVDAWYTLVKTTGFSHQRFPPSQLFDHVIVGVEMNGENRYMDLTTNFFPHTVLPFNDCGAWALDIREGVESDFQLPLDNVDPAKNMISIEINARLDTSRSVDIGAEATHRGLEGAWIRESMARISKEEFRNMILEFMGKGTFQDLRLGEYEVANRMEMNEPLRSSYTFTGERFSDKVSNLYIFRLPWMLAIRNSNALKTRERVTALDVSQLCETAPSRQTARILIPEGYELTEVPQDIEIVSKFGEYRLKFRAIDGGLEVEKEQIFTGTIIEPEQFDEFRAWYLRILDVDEGRYAIIRK